MKLQKTLKIKIGRLSNNKTNILDILLRKNTKAINFCLNKVNRDRKSSRRLTLKEVPKSACLKPIMKAYSSPEKCIKERTRHCAINCQKGKDQAKCSRQTMVECRKIGKGVYKIIR